MDIRDEDPRLARAFAAVSQGHKAKIVWEFVEAYFEGRQKKLDLELFAAAPDGWETIVRQKIEANLFLRNLMQVMQAGEGSARILQPMMDLQDA